MSSIKTANVWAKQLTVGGNTVRQLLVPAGVLELAQSGKSLIAHNNYGAWHTKSVTSAQETDGLALRLPIVVTPSSRADWQGPKQMDKPEEIIESYRGAIGFRSHEEEHSLRRPQIGALHSIIGYWSSGMESPGVIVMPTGTGKTETMIALLVAARPERVLVVVPTSALRTQLADKFESLGILQDLKIVSPQAKRPCVARLSRGIQAVEDAAALARACNVLVTTPDAVRACSKDARSELLGHFSHLIVDEAHHAPATSWYEIIAEFADRKVLMFTATPYREDKRALPGRVIYRFPLREAQKEGYFSPIDYKAVVSLQGTDEQLAAEALQRLQDDLSQGYDHLIMARVKSIPRAQELLETYRKLAPQLSPSLIHSKMRESDKKARIDALNDRTSRVIVCVDMLGEGFDLPALKIAAIHDTKKSLSPMIQFIGRFSRVSSTHNIGGASVFVARDPSTALSPLRELLSEDADWNILLRDISDRATSAAEDQEEFDSSFKDGPEEISVSSLMPKMSAVAHVAPQAVKWNPLKTVDFYGQENIVGSTVSVGLEGSAAWFVLRRNSQVRWGKVESLEQTSYELIVLYYDKARRMLYIHSSENSGTFTDLAAVVLGADPKLISDEQTYRVFAGFKRLVPTNVGLLDVVNHFRRFSMHVGSDVLEALSAAEASAKGLTHIATTGFSDGERISISAAQSGRIWSPQTAVSLKHWVDWCDEQGTKLLDDTINLDQVLSAFIIPKDIIERPPHVLLAVEWPWDVHLQVRQRSVSFNDHAFELADLDLTVDDHGVTGPFLFSITSPEWRIRYSADFEGRRLAYRPISEDAVLVTSGQERSLEEWLNDHSPLLILEGDRVITSHNRLYEPSYDLPPFDVGDIRELDWSGVNIRVESQGTSRREDSIQAFISSMLQRESDFNVLIDDDGAGEAADLVGLEVRETELIVTLVHCKYSSAALPGSRVKDLYEVCGQAVRSAKWRQNGAQPLLRHLDRRAQARYKRTGSSPYEVGDIQELYKIREIATQLRPKFRIILAQPGLSRKSVTTEQLRLLAGADSYVRTVTAAGIELFCSP